MKALESEKVSKMEIGATLDEEEPKSGRPRKGGPGSAVFDLQYVLDINAVCNPYPAIGEKVVLDEEYECEEPEIVRMAQSLLHSKWPEMHSAFSKCIVWCMC
jgi:hypothetical protein